MKALNIIGLILALFACSPASFSQNQDLQRRTRQRPSEVVPADRTPILTERAKIKNELASKAPEHVVWLREMYRNIDLEKENNAALYFPVQPIGNRMNLFTLIFKLLADNKIDAYNYLYDGREVFTNAQRLNFEEMVLKRFGIFYEKQGSGDNMRYLVNDSDIPSNEVLMYQIKEGSYFDAATGMYKSQVTAICPMLVRTDYNVGDVQTNAVCWIPYENLRPYLSRAMIMTSDYNNTLTYSMDDFFTKGMYHGDIIKTVNMRDLSLVQQVGDDPEMLKLAQDSIENQLKDFREHLWFKQDTTTQVEVKAAKKTSTKTNTKTSASRTTTSSKQTKQKQEKASSTSSTPTKSVRRTR